MNRGDRENDKYNSHGYSDPTAYATFAKLTAEERRFKKLIKTIFSICEIAGFAIEGRISLVDKRTGKRWD